ncbi:MAG TPA: 30S ribosomal protein S20 [Limnochordia bacterium]|nr:30S ribosomal protein S20 [Limnochordia bacterium]
MPNIQSARKRVRVAAKRQAYNKSIKSGVKTAVKKAFTVAAQGDAAAAQAAFNQAASQLDKAAAKGVIHPNQAARKKSRLAHRLAKTGVA